MTVVALARWVAAEIVSSILDRAIVPVRERVKAVRKLYKAAKNHYDQLKALAREWAGTRSYRYQLISARELRGMRYTVYKSLFRDYYNYRVDQNSRWGLAPGERYSALPKAARPNRA